MNPTHFGGQRSKVKVTMDIYGNKLVNMIETKPLCISLSNLAEMLTMMRGWTRWIFEVKDIKPLCISASNLAEMLIMVRGWTLFILEVKGQGHSGHEWK